MLLSNMWAEGESHSAPEPFTPIYHLHLVLQIELKKRVYSLTAIK